MEPNYERLLLVARALRESPNPSNFDMNRVATPCGSPACALGHYAARGDLQQSFELLTSCRLVRYFSDNEPSCRVDFDSPPVWHHFGFDEDSWDDFSLLFSARGCGGAKSPIEAAEYIERWVCERRAAMEPKP